MQSVDCNQVIADVLEDMDDSIRETDATIIIGELPVIEGYAVELRLLFQNLVNNALKFRKKEVSPVIKISSTHHGKEFLLTVEDNGIGIQEEFKEKIFIIFKRLHNTVDFEGSGIGLAHCKKIVKLHGGRIWVESEFGVGSTFKFTIPG